jgi:hypothetical protein
VRFYPGAKAGAAWKIEANTIDPLQEGVKFVMPRSGSVRPALFPDGVPNRRP